MKTKAVFVLFSFALSGCSVVGVDDSYEQPRYTVIETVGEDVEIRRYSSRLAAKVTVVGSDPDKSTREAFGLLFDYISGDNTPSAKIEMTSPVAICGNGVTIDMTTPVETAAASGNMTMRFFLPSSFTEKTAPRPTNNRVSIETVPEQTVAALRYSGSRDTERASAKSAVLRKMLAKGAWRPAGEAASYYYDPPWTLPWFRRNEAIVPVTRD